MELFVAGGDFDRQGVFEVSNQSLKAVEDGDILSPPYPPLKRGWKKAWHDPLFRGGIKGGEGVGSAAVHPQCKQI